MGDRSTLRVWASAAMTVGRVTEPISKKNPPLMIPEDVCVVVERYLRLADEALPGRIEGLYLDAVRWWNLDNLNSYWQGLVSRNRHLLGRGVVVLSDSDEDL